jgi:hypothetical protein
MLSAFNIPLYKQIKDLGLKNKLLKVTLPQLSFLIKRLKSQSEATVTEVLGSNIKEALNKVDLVINRTSTYDFAGSLVTAHCKNKMTSARKAFENDVKEIEKRMENRSNAITAYKLSPLQILTACTLLEFAG